MCMDIVNLPELDTFILEPRALIVFELWLLGCLIIMQHRRLMSCLPLQLTLRGKSTTQSYR